MDNKKLRAISGLYLGTLLTITEPPLSKYEEKSIVKRKIEKPIPKGLKEFNIDGHKVYALNKKNAVKKVNKLRNNG